MTKLLYDYVYEIWYRDLTSCRNIPFIKIVDYYAPFLYRDQIINKDRNKVQDTACYLQRLVPTDIRFEIRHKRIERFDV